MIFVERFKSNNVGSKSDKQKTREARVLFHLKVNPHHHIVGNFVI